jgi:uncharacterized protein (DUF608 family)
MQEGGNIISDCCRGGNNEIIKSKRKKVYCLNFVDQAYCTNISTSGEVVVASPSVVDLSAFWSDSYRLE